MHCSGFFYGIASVDWWDKASLNLLTDRELSILTDILHRNKMIDGYIKGKISTLSETFDVKPHHLHRLSNTELLVMINIIDKINEKQDLIEFLVDNKVQCLKTIPLIGDYLNQRVNFMLEQRHNKDREDVINDLPAW